MGEVHGVMKYGQHLDDVVTGNVIYHKVPPFSALSCDVQGSDSQSNVVPDLAAGDRGTVVKCCEGHQQC